MTWWTPRPPCAAPIAGSATRSPLIRGVALPSSTSRIARSAAVPGGCSSATCRMAPRRWRWSRRAWSEQPTLHSPEPGIPLILPVAARPLAGEGHAGQILGELVSQLDGRIEAQRRAVVLLQRLVVVRIGQNGLRVHRADQIPTIVVPAVERIEP